MNQVLLGAIGMASLVASLFFARFWRATRDRFFLFFAASFCLEGINRFAIGAYAGIAEDEPTFYLIRLAAFLLIIVAIVDKNRSSGAPSSPQYNG